MTLRDLTNQHTMLEQRGSCLRNHRATNQHQMSSFQETVNTNMQTFKTNILNSIAAFEKSMSQVNVDVDAQVRKQ